MTRYKYYAVYLMNLDGFEEYVVDQQRQSQTVKADFSSMNENDGDAVAVTSAGNYEVAS